MSASSVAGLGGLIHVMAQHHARRGVRCSHARSNGLRGRYGRHCRPWATYRQAAFAFQLAREASGHTKATYCAGPGSRRRANLPPSAAAR